MIYKLQQLDHRCLLTVYDVFDDSFRMTRRHEVNQHFLILTMLNVVFSFFASWIADNFFFSLFVTTFIVLPG